MHRVFELLGASRHAGFRTSCPARRCAPSDASSRASSSGEASALSHALQNASRHAKSPRPSHASCPVPDSCSKAQCRRRFAPCFRFCFVVCSFLCAFSLAENCAGNHRYKRHLCTARYKCGRHNRHTAVTLIFNSTACHNSRNSAACAYKHRNKGFS